MMEAELREQPSVLTANAGSYFEQCQPLAKLDYDLVVIAARGSSDHAALYARYLIEIFLGVPVCLAAPSVITLFKAKLRYPKTLAIGISQSGAAPDVSEVIEGLREMGHSTLAITNTAGSRLADAADHVLLLEVGEEKAVAATKTYTTSLLALYQLVRVLGGDLEDPKLPGPEWVEESCTAAESHVPMLLRNSIQFSLGRGYSFATAQECALKLMECALLPCKAYSSADFEHGPKALAGANSAAIDFTGTAREGNGFEVAYAPIPDCSAMIAPIWQAIYAQWLALLAARARGYDPDKPEGLSKVTRTL